MYITISSSELLHALPSDDPLLVAHAGISDTLIPHVVHASEGLAEERAGHKKPGPSPQALCGDIPPLCMEYLLEGTGEPISHEKSPDMQTVLWR